MRMRIALGMLIGVSALALALWGVPIEAVGRSLAQANAQWLLPIALLFVVQQLLRAWRQALLIRATHPSLSYRDSLSVLCIGFLFINSLPARIGEVVRPLLLKERADVPLGTGFGMVLVERVIDLCATLIMVAAVGLLVPIDRAALPAWILGPYDAAAPLLPAGVLLLVASLVVLAAGGQNLVKRIWRWQPKQASLQRQWASLGTFVGGIVEGFGALRDPRRLAGVLALTVATWTLSGWLFVWTAYAFELEAWIGYGEGIGILSVTMLSMALPSAPGFAGTYEVAVRLGLAAFGVSGWGLAPKAIAFALVVHWWVFAVQAATAFVFLALDGLPFHEIATRALAQRRQPSRTNAIP